MNKQGFLLADSLITLLVVSVMAVFCICIFNAKLNYQKGYENYYSVSKEEYETIYYKIGKCEKCTVQKDSFPQEP